MPADDLAAVSAPLDYQARTRLVPGSYHARHTRTAFPGFRPVSADDLALVALECVPGLEEGVRERDLVDVLHAGVLSKGRVLATDGGRLGELAMASDCKHQYVTAQPQHSHSHRG